MKICIYKSSIVLNSTHIIDTINNSRFQIDFERSVSLLDKHIALTSASLYFSWRNSRPLTINFRIFGLTT